MTKRIIQYIVFVIILGIFSVALSESSLAAPGIAISQPQEGEEFFPGDQIFLSVEAIEGFVIDQVLFVSPFTNETLTAPPYYVNFTIPDDVIGSVKIMAVGRDASEQFVSDEVSVNVVPSSASPLQSLQAGLKMVSIQEGNAISEYSGIYMDLKGNPLQMNVEGMYSDGAKRKLQSADTGTTYVSNDSAIVTVNEEGLLTAQGIGKTTVTATNSGISVDVPVTVTSDTPTVSIVLDDPINGQVYIKLTFSGILQQSTDGVSWSDVSPQPTSPWVTVADQDVMLYRAR